MGFRKAQPPYESEVASRVTEILRNPGAWIHPVMSEPGHSLPNSTDLVSYDCDSPAALDAISARHGVEVAQGPESKGNLVALHPDLKLPRCRIQMSGAGSTIILGRNAAVVGELNTGDESLIVVTGQTPGRVLQMKITLRDRGERLFWGSGSSARGFNTSVRGDDLAIVIGDGCMFSWGVWARPHDMHLIIDPITGEVLNPGQDIVVEPHVWVGQSSLLLRGVRIGAGSVVGANSVMTGSRNYPPMGLHVGQPARTIRTGVTWDRASRPSPAAIERARAVYRKYSAGVDDDQ